MQRSIILISSLFSSLILAQKQVDTTKVSSLEGVVIHGFTKKDTETTNKMPLKFIENPQVFSSISNMVLQNQIIFTVDDAYRNVTGLQKMWNATGRSGDGSAYTILRGFISNGTLRNGLAAPVTTVTDAVNLERLEVLKGPSATLFGSNLTSYGGAINRVTKKPHEGFNGELAFSGGSYNYYRVSADVNAPVTNDNKLLFRVNTSYANSGTFQQKDAQNEFITFAPSLRYKPNDKLDINVDLEMFENEAMAEQMFFYLNNLPAFGYHNIKDIQNNLGLDYKQSYVGKDLKSKSRVRNIFGQINYTFNKHIKSSTNISNAYSESNGYSPYFAINTQGSVSGNQLQNELGIVRSDQSTRNSKREFFQFQQNFNFDFKFGEMRNRTVAGFDYMNRRDNQMFISAANIDWVPFKGGDYSTFNKQTLGDFYHNNPKKAGNYPIEAILNTYSGYVSNVFTPIEGLNILAALRYESNVAKNGVLYSAKTKAYNQAALSPKFGLVYEIIPNQFSVFGNYQNSFKSNGYYAIDKENFALSDPERANQFEGGVKMNVFNNKLNATISYYDIRVKDLLVGTGEYTSSFAAIQRQAGKVKSQGVELEVNAYLLKGFSLIAGLAYNDSKITEDVNPQLIGTRPFTSGSKWLTNFYASYQLLDGKMKGLGIGFGGNYASKNNIADKFYLPDFFVLNANVFYDTKRFRVGIKADNITNTHYWIGYSTANPQTLLNIVSTFAIKF